MRATTRRIPPPPNGLPRWSPSWPVVLYAPQANSLTGTQALESDENLCREDFSTWNWARSPQAFGNAATPSQYAQPCSTANVASYESSATCADLSCGESGVFERSGLPDGCDARRGLEASSRTGYNVGSSGAGDTQVGTQADGDSDLQDMIRWGPRRL